MARLKRGIPTSKKTKYILFAITVVVVFKLCFVGRGSFLNIYRSGIKASKFEEQYNELLVKIDETEVKIDKLNNDPEYIIKFARERYGMQRADEHVTIIIESE